MGKTNFLNRAKRVSVVLTGCLLIVFTLHGCAHQKVQLNATQFRFDLDEKEYRIRSISTANKTEAYNELIGEDFVAVDFDQDQVIDRILLGEVSLNEVQRIYDHGLDRVARQNKLILRTPSNNRYVYESCGLQLEIRSFRPSNAQPFNEFRIRDQRQVISPPTIVIVDHEADGILDEVLKGSVELAKAQSQYAEALEAGLQKGRLAKVNGAILVKEK